MTDDRIGLEALLALRGAAHRIGGAPMRTIEELTTWLTASRIALVSGHSAIPNAAEAIAGESIRGSWWGHLQGALIFELLTELEGDDTWLDVALVEGKHTLVAPSVAPSVLALASDPERRARVVTGLPEAARRLWDVLATGEQVNSDDPRFSGKSWRPARQALEAGLLAGSRSEHTDSGHHVAWVEAFGEGRQLGNSSGLSEVLQACLSSAVVAERREVVRWLRAVEPDKVALDRAVDALGVPTLTVEDRTWLVG